jgi:hypothetical protein
VEEKAAAKSNEDDDNDDVDEESTAAVVEKESAKPTQEDEFSKLIASEFGKASFNSEKWTADRFTNTTFQLMKEKQRELQRLKALAASELKSAVSDNYETFIKTSRELGNLEIDMAEVRTVLSDIGSNMKALEAFKLQFGHHQVGLASAQATQADFREKNELRLQLQSVSASMDWLVDVPDVLDACVVERNFELAVDTVEKTLKLSNNEALEAQLVVRGVRRAIDESVERLRQALITVLRSKAGDAAEARTAIAQMRRLGWAEHAREAFLQQRSDGIAAGVRRLAFGGDRRQYVGDAARLVFASIIATCDDFVASFVERTMMSAFVVWAVREIELFAMVFVENVFHADSTFELMGDCIAIGQQHW